MIDFLVKELTESNIYQMYEFGDEGIGLEDPTGRKIHVIPHTKKITKDDFKKQVHDYWNKNTEVAHVFFKDYENFFVKLGLNEGMGRPFKRHTRGDIEQMLHLRDLEKLVLEQFPHSKQLAYYQPKIGSIPESLKLYSMRDVILDYTHIPLSDPRHEHVPGVVTSKDYKIPVELKREDSTFLTLMSELSKRNARFDFV